MTYHIRRGALGKRTWCGRRPGFFCFDADVVFNQSRLNPCPECAETFARAMLDRAEGKATPRGQELRHAPKVFTALDALRAYLRHRPGDEPHFRQLEAELRHKREPWEHERRLVLPHSEQASRDMWLHLIATSSPSVPEQAR